MKETVTYYCYVNCKIMKIRNFLQTYNDTYLIGQIFKEQNQFFRKPCPSEILSVYYIANISKNVKYFSVTHIKAKLLVLPYNGNFVAFPLHHTFKN